MRYISGPSSEDPGATTGDSGVLPVYEDDSGNWYYVGNDPSGASTTLILKISNLINQTPTGIYDDASGTVLPGTTRKDLLKESYSSDWMTAGAGDASGNSGGTDNRLLYALLGAGLLTFTVFSPSDNGGR